MKLFYTLVLFYSTLLQAQNCPEGYINVPANEAYQVKKKFCVMKYEARAFKVDANQINMLGCMETECKTNNWASLYNETKNKSGYRPVSVSDGLPWRKISQLEAMEACKSLGPEYSLISNEEWMVIAENIVNDARNWSGGKVAQGFLNRGHSDDNPKMVCDSNVENVEGSCNLRGLTFDQKRTHTLSNNEVIWDFAGNSNNWTSWRLNQDARAYSSSDKTTVEAWRELTSIDMKVGSSNEMSSKNWMPSNHPRYDSVHNIGEYWSGNISGVSGGARGGRFSNGKSAGIYALDLSIAPNGSSHRISFRCVYKN